MYVWYDAEWAYVIVSYRHIGIRKKGGQVDRIETARNMTGDMVFQECHNKDRLRNGLCAITRTNITRYGYNRQYEIRSLRTSGQLYGSRPHE